MLDGNDRGRFVWYDLMTSDPGKAQPFYQQVAGWGTQPFNSDYSMWTVNGKPIGGVMDLPRAGVPPHWIGYVAVPDVDAAVRQTELLGGKAHVPGTDIPNVGRFAILADPQGAVFAVFAGNAPEQGDKPVAGDFSWHELATTDYKAAFAFYQALVGWETIAEHDMGPMGIYFIFGRNGTQLGGMFNKPTEMPWPPNWLQYVLVDSADKAAERVKANGGQVLNGPMDVPGGDRIAQCLDPQGGAFAVHSRQA